MGSIFDNQGGAIAWINMTQFPHDQFAKNLLEVLLSVFGEVHTSLKVVSQVREIDVYFIRNLQHPIPGSPELGLLAQLAANSAIFEIFRNPVKLIEVETCSNKVNDLRAKITNEGKPEKGSKKITPDLPILWILTPTLSQKNLEYLRAIDVAETWGKGVYLLRPQHIGIVVIHQLPVTKETLWLRLLGRGKVQLRAIKQIAQLGKDSPYSQNVLELFSDLLLMLKIKQDVKREEQELIMQLSPLYLEKIKEAEARGKAEGKAEEKLALVLQLLPKRLRVAELSPELQKTIQSLPLTKLDQLAEALLDFQGIQDLIVWLDINIFKNR